MIPPTLSQGMTQTEFEALIKDLRPGLHRYATRMTGSAIDGEDVVQEAVIKAYYSLNLLTSGSSLRSWLFRITHNKAIDHLRRGSDQPLELLDEIPAPADPDDPLVEKELAAVALSMFVKLAPRQRSCVILKDVLGYSLAEISELLDATVPEIKATLHRGRTRLRELAAITESAAPALDSGEQERLARYIDHFNARDFDAVRAMLADEVQLDLVGRSKANGLAEISGRYFHNYAQAADWQMAPGTVEGLPAILVRDPAAGEAPPKYFILITWDGDRVARIRDYIHAPHVIQDAHITTA